MAINRAMRIKASKSRPGYSGSSCVVDKSSFDASRDRGLPLPNVISNTVTSSSERTLCRFGMVNPAFCVPDGGIFASTMIVKFSASAKAMPHR